MKKKLTYTKRLGNSVARRALSSNLMKYHVISGDSSWRVVSDGRMKALRAFSTEEQAVDYAKDMAFKKTGEVVIHDGKGQIKNRISFGLVNS
jgi:hypothetical protein